MYAVPVAMSLLRSASPCNEFGELVQALGELVVALGERAQHRVQVRDDLADELIASRQCVRQRRCLSQDGRMVPPWPWNTLSSSPDSALT